MTTEEKLRTLQTFSLFDDVSEKAMHMLSERMYPKEIKQREVFIEQGLESHHAFFIYRGAASTYRTTEEGQIINIDILGAPEVVGEVGLIDNHPNAVSAMALDDIDALIISQHDFQEIVHLHPEVSFIFMKLFAKAVTYFDEFLEELFCKNLHERTMIILSYLASFFANRVITLSQEELSDLLWGTRARVTEVLHELEAEGKIRVEHKKITIL